MNRSARGLLLLLCLPAAACLQTPPVLSPISVKAPSIPMPPPLTENSQFGYLRAHQIVRFTERIGAGALVTMAGSRGIDLRALDPDKSLVVVVGDPQGGGFDKLPLAALLPISPGGQMAQMLAAIAGADRAVPYGGGVAFSLNQPPVDATHGGALLDTLAAAPLAADMEMYVRVTSLMARYGEQVRKGLGQVQTEMQKDKSGKVSPELAAAYVDWLNNIIDKLDSVTIGVAATESAIEMTTIDADKVQGPRVLPDHAESMHDLAQFMPAGDFRFEAGGKDLTRWIELAIKLYQPMLKDDPATFARLKAIMTTFGKGRTQVAGTISLGGDRLFTGATVMLVDDADQKLNSAREMFELVNTPGMQKFYAASGIKLDAQLQREVRKVEGWPVDHATYKLTLLENSKTPASMKRFFDKPIEADVMRIGSYLVYQFNAAPGALEKTVHDLLAGKGENPPLTARADHPAGGFLYLDMDVPRLLTSVATLVPEDKRGDIPQFDPSIPHVTLFGYDAGSVSYYRSSMPMRLVNAIREASSGGGKKQQGGPYLPQPKE